MLNGTLVGLSVPPPITAARPQWNLRSIAEPDHHISLFTCKNAFVLSKHLSLRRNLRGGLERIKGP